MSAVGVGVGSGVMPMIRLITEYFKSREHVEVVGVCELKYLNLGV